MDAYGHCQQRCHALDHGGGPRGPLRPAALLGTETDRGTQPAHPALRPGARGRSGPHLPSTASATSRSRPTPVSPCPYVHAWKKVSAASVRIGYSILSPVDQRECVRLHRAGLLGLRGGRLTRLQPRAARAAELLPAEGINAGRVRACAAGWIARRPGRCSRETRMLKVPSAKDAKGTAQENMSFHHTQVAP